jgi:hypothetical protein
MNGFDEFAADQTVYVTANGMYLADTGSGQSSGVGSKSYVTDSRGEFLIELDDMYLPADGVAQVTIRAGNNEQTFTLNGKGLDIGITVDNVVPFTDSNRYSTASLTARVTDASGNPVNGATVIWRVESARNNSPAMFSGWGNKKTGLTWGATPEPNLTASQLPEERITGGANESAYNKERKATTTAGSGETTQQLTDIVGEREITVKAEVIIHGPTYSVTMRTVSFSKGPLSAFKAPVGTVPPESRTAAGQTCNGNENLPTSAELKVVSRYDSSQSGSAPSAQGAAIGAGWPTQRYWAREYTSGDHTGAYVVDLSNGYTFGNSIGTPHRVVCRR